MIIKTPFQGRNTGLDMQKFLVCIDINVSENRAEFPEKRLRPLFYIKAEKGGNLLEHI